MLQYFERSSFVNVSELLFCYQEVVKRFGPVPTDFLFILYILLYNFRLHDHIYVTFQGMSGPNT